MALRDWLFEAPEPAATPEGWWFEVRGTEARRYGPFTDQDAALGAQLQLFRRYDRAARARGGWAWRSTAARWVVTLPPEVPARGLPLHHAPCSQHQR